MLNEPKHSSGVTLVVTFEFFSGQSKVHSNPTCCQKINFLHSEVAGTQKKLWPQAPAPRRNSLHSGLRTMSHLVEFPPPYFFFFFFEISCEVMFAQRSGLSKMPFPVTNPGFPRRGVHPRGGGVHPRGGSANLSNFCPKLHEN